MAVNDEVNLVLDLIFGAENLSKYPTIRPLLRIGLASHLHHYDSLARPVYHSQQRPTLPQNSVLRNIALFTNPRVLALKEHVRIAMPWDDHYKYFKKASGLPPHVLIFAQIQGVHKDVHAIPSKLESILDERQMAGPVSLAQIGRVVDESPQMRSMINDMAELKAMMQRRMPGAADGAVAGGGNTIGMRNNALLYPQYGHTDGKTRRVPSTWTIPKLPIQQMYLYWHCGNEADKIPPMKFFKHHDISFLQKRAKSTMSELRKIMLLIDNTSRSKGFPVKNSMSHEEANTCYYHGESALAAVIPDTTSKGRPRAIATMKWGSLVKYLYKKRGPAM